MGPGPSESSSWPAGECRLPGIAAVCVRWALFHGASAASCASEPGGDRLTLQQIAECPSDARRGDAPLAATVAIADRDGLVGQALAVDGDAKGRARFILPAIPPADRPFFVVRRHCDGA